MRKTPGRSVCIWVDTSRLNERGKPQGCFEELLCWVPLDEPQNITSALPLQLYPWSYNDQQLKKPGRQI